MATLTISTKYIPTTKTKGSQIQATTTVTKVSRTIPYPHELSGVECHIRAVECLLKRQLLPNEFAIGELETGYVFVAIK